MRILAVRAAVAAASVCRWVAPIGFDLSQRQPLAQKIMLFLHATYLREPKMLQSSAAPSAF